MKKRQLKIINPVPDVVLFSISLVTQGFQQPRWKKFIGMNFNETFSAYERGFLNWYVHYPHWKKFGQSMFNAILRNKKLARFLYAEHKRLGRYLYHYTDKVQSLNARDLTSRRLVEIFDRLTKDFYDICLWGGGIAAMDFENNLLTEWLEQEITRRANRFGLLESVPQLMSVLMTPRELSYTQQEKVDLLRLASRKTVHKRDILHHTQKYFWINYGYINLPLTESYFHRALQKVLRGHPTPQRQLRTLASERSLMNVLQARYLRFLRANGQLRYMVSTAQKVMFLKQYRKEIMYKSYAAFSVILREISRRYHYAFTELQYCLPQEIRALLGGQRIDRSELRKRRTGFFVHACVRGEDSFMYGQSARKFIHENLHHEAIQHNVKELSGMPAFLGVARGRVKIINTVADMKKMKQGDILVSIATSPTILPAMAKAAAFVTDTGGITCHAAIVARELKTPCVIGTKIATKVLKDGDRVEVDAMRGLVKKI